MSIPFLDLVRETKRLRRELDAAIDGVVTSGQFVLSEEVYAFEQAFADYCHSEFAIGVASGTDAITIALLAAGVRDGDEVIAPANTCVPTIVGIERAGAIPVLADVDAATYTLDPEQVERRATRRTKAIIPVHLYGQLANLRELSSIADRRGIAIVEDCAQSHGAKYDGRPAGSYGIAAAYSFYPTKNLGALGDGGAVVTSDSEVARRARLLRNYGEQGRFEHIMRGLNSRLDSIQAAVLAVKLRHLDAANARRRSLAAIYDAELGGGPLVVPARVRAAEHVFHLYVVQTDHRDSFRSRLEEHGVGSAVHYPKPIHRQRAYRQLDVDGGFPVSEALTRRVVSLPMSADHTEEEITRSAEVAAAASA